MEIDHDWELMVRVELEQSVIVGRQIEKELDWFSVRLDLSNVVWFGWLWRSEVVEEHAQAHEGTAICALVSLAIASREPWWQRDDGRASVVEGSCWEMILQ